MKKTTKKLTQKEVDSVFVDYLSAFCTRLIYRIEHNDTEHSIGIKKTIEDEKEKFLDRMGFGA